MYMKLSAALPRWAGGTAGTTLIAFSSEA